MLALLAATIGAVANRLRGGGVVLFPGETTVPDHKRTQMRRMVYLFALGSIAMLGGAALWQAALGALAVFLMLLTGWGRPIGAVGGWETQPLEEFGPLDWATNKLVGTRHERLWGVVWLTLWGAAVAIGPCLVLQSWWPLAWAGMGVIYWATGLVMKAVSGNAGDGRELAEWVYGALLGGTLALAMGV